MSSFNVDLGRGLLGLGLLLIVIGCVMMLAERIQLPFLGRLPGDITIHKKSFTFYFPLTTCLLLSALLSLLLLLWRRR